MDTRWWLLQYILPSASFAGLAELLRSKQELTWRSVASATLNSGLFGLAIGAIMLQKFGTEHFNLIWGIATLAGLGGSALIDFAVELLRAWMKRKATDDQI